MASAREAVTLVCNLISARMGKAVKPETLRRAKFDDHGVANELWDVLVVILCQHRASSQGIDVNVPRLLSSLEQETKRRLVGSLLLHLGYRRMRFYQLPSPRELLVALGWCLGRLRLLQAENVLPCQRYLSEEQHRETSRLMSGTGPSRPRQELDVADLLRQLGFKIEQLYQAQRQSQAHTEALIALHKRIAALSSLSVDELSAMRTSTRRHKYEEHLHIRYGTCCGSLLKCLMPWTIPAEQSTGVAHLPCSLVPVGLCATAIRPLFVCVTFPFSLMVLVSWSRAPSEKLGRILKGAQHLPVLWQWIASAAANDSTVAAQADQQPLFAAGHADNDHVDAIDQQHRQSTRRGEQKADDTIPSPRQQDMESLLQELQTRLDEHFDACIDILEQLVSETDGISII